jgi:beta-fructofuranosidase
MRDPWVMRSPRGDGWLMFFTARVPGHAEPNAGGAIGLATSPDLYAWTLRPPVYAGGLFGQMEVPQAFERAGRWYLVFCTSSAHWSEAYRAFNPQKPVSGTHYLIADDPLGPWRVAPGSFLDGHNPCRRYAGKVVATSDGLKLLGFLHSTPEQAFVGGISDPVPLRVDSEGLLRALEA